MTSSIHYDESLNQLSVVYGIASRHSTHLRLDILEAYRIISLPIQHMSDPTGAHTQTPDPTYRETQHYDIRF